MGNEGLMLRDDLVSPDEQTLESVLGGLYPAFKELTDVATAPDIGLELNWRFYEDSRAWLCKATNKGKTVFWLSVWEDFFRVAFYFTEKHLERVAALDISDEVKEEFFRAQTFGRMIPMIFDLRDDKWLPDVFTVMRFKKTLK